MYDTLGRYQLRFIRACKCDLATVQTATDTSPSCGYGCLVQGTIDFEFGTSRYVQFCVSCMTCHILITNTNYYY